MIQAREARVRSAFKVAVAGTLAVVGLMIGMIVTLLVILALAKDEHYIIAVFAFLGMVFAFLFTMAYRQGR